MTENELRTKLEEIGWFDGFTPALIKATEESIRWSINQGLEALSPPVAVFMDLECLDALDQPYLELLEKFSQSSYDLLQPIDVKEEYLEYEGFSSDIENLHNSNALNDLDGVGEFTLTFENDGRSYKATFVHDSKWVAEAFFDLLDQLLVESGSHLRFVELSQFTGDVDQMLIFIVANLDLVKIAVESNLLLPHKYNYKDDRWYPREPGEFFP